MGKGWGTGLLTPPVRNRIKKPVEHYSLCEALSLPLVIDQRCMGKFSSFVVLF